MDFPASNVFVVVAYGTADYASATRGVFTEVEPAIRWALQEAESELLDPGDQIVVEGFVLDDPGCSPVEVLRLPEVESDE